MAEIYGITEIAETPADEFAADPLAVQDAELIAAEEERSERDTLLLGAIHDAEQTAYGGDGDSGLASERARSIDDYLGKPYGNEVDGRSQVISRDVYDTIEWIKPSLLRIFTGGDQVAKFEPVGPEDEGGAKQETDYINYVVQEKNPWFTICYEWFTDALLTKNAYALAYWDTTKTVESERYEGLTDEQFTMLVNEDGVEVVEHSERVNEVAQMQQMQMQQAMAQQMEAQRMAAMQQLPPGMPPPPMPELPPMTVPMLHDVVIRRTKEIKGAKICVLPPERCMVSENVPGMSVRNADFFGFWEMKSISDIRKMGFEIADDVSDDYRTIGNEEDEARDQFEEDTLRSLDGTNDPSMRKVALRMSWIKYDYDDDGIAEHRYVVHVGENILYNEECSGVPVACIVPTPLPHRHPGLSVRDMVTDLQEIKTALWRGGLDNLYLANNGRYGVSDKVNLSDMLSSRPGGVVRVKGGAPMQEIFPFTHPVTIAPALQMMEYTDSIRQSRTGTSQAFTGVDPNALSKSHSGIAISQLTSAAAQRVEMIARVFADGVKELLLVVHELCIKHGHQNEVMKISNEWVTVNPSQWKKRYDMKLSVGLGTGNKEQLMANLTMILQAQQQALPFGIAGPKQIYNALTELTKAAGFASPDQFWMEPKPGQGPQNQPNPEVVKTQMEMQLKEREMQMKARLEERKAQQNLQYEQIRSTNDVTIEREKIAAQMELERWKAQLARDTELEKTRMQIMARRELEEMKIRGGLVSQLAQGGMNA